MSRQVVTFRMRKENTLERHWIDGYRFARSRCLGAVPGILKWSFKFTRCHNNISQYMRGFLKWWYPTTIGFPTTKDNHFGVFWGYHHFRKHPYGNTKPGDGFKKRPGTSACVEFPGPFGPPRRAGWWSSCGRDRVDTTGESTLFPVVAGLPQLLGMKNVENWKKGLKVVVELLLSGAKLWMCVEVDGFLF